MSIPAAPAFERVCVAVDAAANAPDALRAAATLAAAFDAELAGLFVEDLNLVRAAELSFTRELGIESGVSRPLAAEDIERSLRVQAEAMNWGTRGARVNAISPGVIMTPLGQHELNSEIGDIYRTMVEASPSKRMAPPEEIAIAASFLLGPDAGFITGSDLLIDGGVIAAMRAGKLQTPG